MVMEGGRVSMQGKVITDSKTRTPLRFGFSPCSSQARAIDVIARTASCAGEREGGVTGL